MTFDNPPFDNPTFDNPTFDNTTLPTPTKWEGVKSHAPVLLLAGGAVALFISLHTAAFAVAIAAGLHVALGLVIAVAGWVRSPKKASQPREVRQ